MDGKGKPRGEKSWVYCFCGDRRTRITAPILAAMCGTPVESINDLADRSLTKHDESHRSNQMMFTAEQLDSMAETAEAESLGFAPTIREGRAILQRQDAGPARLFYGVLIDCMETDAQNRRRPGEQDPRSRIYFFHDSANRRIKIGTSRNVQQRLKKISQPSGLALELLGEMAGGQQIEQEIHMRFKELRLRGEWFQDSPAIRQFIAENCAATTPA